jgi:hypothetical protein
VLLEQNVSNRRVPRACRLDVNQLGFDFPAVEAAKKPRRRRPERPAPSRYQLALHLDDQGMTPLMLRLEATLRRMSNTAAIMPSFETLNTLAQGRSRSGVYRALVRLEAMGRIAIDQVEGRRRVVILHTGRATGWGNFKPGKAPYSTDRTKPDHRARRNAHASVERSGAGFHKPESDARSNVKHHFFVYQNSAAPPFKIRDFQIETCQFPRENEPGQRTLLFCGKPTTRGSSWCLDCKAQVFSAKGR